MTQHQQQQRRLFVTGASGGIGRLVVQQAIERGHAVTAHVRTTSSYTPPEPAVLLKQDSYAGEPARLDGLDGHDAVISCLGNRHKNPSNPFSALAARADFCTHSARVLVDAMARASVKRVAAISAAGVGDSAPRMNLMMKILLRLSPIGTAYRDLRKMEDVYRETDLEWVACRPTTLTNGRLTGTVRIVDAFTTFSMISRADVAHWLLDAIERDDWFGTDERTPQLRR